MSDSDQHCHFGFRTQLQQHISESDHWKRIGEFPIFQLNCNSYYSRSSVNEAILKETKETPRFYRPFNLSHLMTKPTMWLVRPAKTQISLGIRQNWSESSLSAWRKLGSLATHWAHSEGSDQTGRMPRLIWVFAGRPCHFGGFVTRWLSF